MCPVPVPEDAGNAMTDHNGTKIARDQHAGSGQDALADALAAKRAPLFAFDDGGRTKRTHSVEHAAVPTPSADGKQSTERSATSSAGTASPFDGRKSPSTRAKSPTESARSLTSGSASPRSESGADSTTFSPNLIVLPPMSEALRRTPQEKSDDEDTSDHGRIPLAPQRVAQGIPGVKTLHRCADCGKVYKHRNCLVKHLWEHHELWGATKRMCQTKHQQVQMLEAAHVLAEMAVPVGMRTAIELTTLPPPSASAFRSMLPPRSAAMHIVPAAGFAHGAQHQSQNPHTQAASRAGTRLAPMAPRPRP